MDQATETSVLSQALHGLAGSLTRTEAEHLVSLKPDEATCQLLDTLARKANEGELTDRERRLYEAHVRAGNLMTLLQAKARLVLAGSD